ncbi:MAG TPA: hypothetical protein VGR56_00715 [Nitrososphaerales archaeon]|nr:hypothetical protein [Nitrososphaerales archaeon]
MRSQRFRAFHTLVLIEPLDAVSDKEHGGYIDGLLARLMAKARLIIVVSKPIGGIMPSNDVLRSKEVLRAILYGTRLSKPELLEKARLVFLPIPEKTLVREFEKLGLRLSKKHTRYRLDAFNEELLQGMVPRTPPRSEETEPSHIKQFFRRNKRFKAEAYFPDRLLANRALEDVGKRGWTTVPEEAQELSIWLHELNEVGDPRIRAIYESNEDISNEQWDALLAPTRHQVKRVLDALVGDGKLQMRTWFKEVGRPTRAYVALGKAPFLEQCCGQCAFYAAAKRRCNLWWLTNKRWVFYDDRWKRVGSPVTSFEIHKMRYASRIGPHSSACARFLDKKRDHLRKSIPHQCEICREVIPPTGRVSITCENCRTMYVRWRSQVRVMTAYEHEFNRLYHEITGGEAKVDLDEWRREMKESLRITHPGVPEAEEFDDVMAEEVPKPELGRPRAWPQFNPALQLKVDTLASMTDITKQFTIAMAKSALNATRRMATFAKLYPGDTDSFVSQQEKYLALINMASPTRLLPFEAQVMRQYWACYGLALKSAQQWSGPRKRSRFVREFVEDPAGKARGYSPVDAAVNYLHQRRLRQAEHINAEVGFPGTCDGFLHREHHNSRKIGLLLDMIDPFKFADREELLVVFLNQGLTWKDFKIETDRRGSNFYYPMATAAGKLDQVGLAADSLIVRYQAREMELNEAYKRFAESLLEKISGNNTKSLFDQFEYGFAE